MTNKKAQRSVSSSSHSRTGLFISIALHTLILVFLLVNYTPPTPRPQIFSVSLERPPNPRIVSPSNTASQKPPNNTTHLSDKDSSTDIEQIRRGTSGAPKRAPLHDEPQEISPSSKHPVPQPKKSQKQVARSEKAITLKYLRLDSSTLSSKFASTRESAQEPNAQSTTTTNYKAFSRPQGSGATFIGTGGISDHLPNLPDGDITLLNAKANVCARFVRRVAIQVFTQLRTQGWDRLRASDIQKVRQHTVIEAVLSPQGVLIETRIVEQSGSPSFDRVVESATQSGAKDPNPPEGAQAGDGTIHFIFKARSWTQLGANPRSGAPTEYRWLLLATGLL